jgi:hypothetical protein
VCIVFGSIPRKRTTQDGLDELLFDVHLSFGRPRAQGRSGYRPGRGVTSIHEPLRIDDNSA